MYLPARPPPSLFGSMLTPVVRALLISIAVAYAAALFTLHWLGRPDLVAYGWLVPSDVIEKGWIWQVVSYMWLHDPGSPWHLLLNLLGLYMFGGFLERAWGGKRFLLYYLLTGVGAGLTVLIVGWFYYPDVPTIGCSGAVLGVATAFGLIYADRPIFLFGLLPMRARTMLILILAWVLLDWLMQRSNVSVAGHLGGMFWGWLLISGWWRPSRWRIALARRRYPNVVRFERRDPDAPGPWIH